MKYGMFPVPHNTFEAFFFFSIHDPFPGVETDIVTTQSGTPGVLAGPGTRNGLLSQSPCRRTGSQDNFYIRREQRTVLLPII